MKLLRKILSSTLMFVGVMTLGAFSGINLFINLIGKSTALDDGALLMDRLPSFFSWLASTPWWVAPLLLLVPFGTSIAIYWPEITERSLFFLEKERRREDDLKRLGTDLVELAQDIAKWNLHSVEEEQPKIGRGIEARLSAALMICKSFGLATAERNGATRRQWLFQLEQYLASVGTCLRFGNFNDAKQLATEESEKINATLASAAPTQPNTKA
ncbi:hypothetical protein [Hyphomonas sp.]|uniref:hypothetical protein n=1 Tax=Hyphomonas sp. TaxID=87 RepID=UPI00324230C0